MKRDSKGQRVKTFKAFIPDADLKKTETQVVVYFKADNGEFSIYDGAHMFAAARERVQKKTGRELSVFDNRITAYSLNVIVQGFADLSTAYEHEMRETLKKKVIRFTFKCNTKWDGEHQAKNDISFCGTPAVHIDYEILYQIGDQLYERVGDEDHSTLHYRGSAKEARFRDGEAVTVDWTEEREAFFENMRASLVSLIHRVDAFQQNLLVNVDRAIAGEAPLLLEKKS